MGGTKKWLVEHLKINYKYTFEELEFDEDLFNEAHDVICRLENSLAETQAKLDKAVEALEWIDNHISGDDESWYDVSNLSEQTLKELREQESETTRLKGE